MVNVYISSCDKDGGIYRYALGDDGRLTELSKTSLVTPSYLAISDGVLHATLRAPFLGSDYSGYTTLLISRTGELTPSGEILPSGGISACHISVAGGVAYATNYMTGSIKRFPDILIEKTGGSGVNPERQATPHPHCIIPTPDGKYLAVCDLGCDTLTLYDFELNEVSKTHAGAGVGPRHLTFSPDGGLAYVINELKPVTTVYRYSDGEFLRLCDYPVLPYKPEGKYGGSGAGSAIRCVGDYLYVGVREGNKITCYKRVGEGLEYLFTSTSGAEHPRDFNIFGDILVSANMMGDNVSVFKIIEGRGLEKIQDIQMKSPTCILFFETTGE